MISIKQPTKARKHIRGAIIFGFLGMIMVDMDAAGDLSLILDLKQLRKKLTKIEIEFPSFAKNSPKLKKKNWVYFAF